MMRKWLFIKLIGAIILFTSCSGAVRLKIQTAESSSVEGIFETDTIHNGTPVGNVNIELHLVGRVVRDKTESLTHHFETDSTGNYIGAFTVPPLKKKPVYKGYMTWAKKGYKSDTLQFNHSSLENWSVIINMVKDKPSL